nr:nonstructural polyprotein [Picornaviridae sp.]
MSETSKSENSKGSFFDIPTNKKWFKIVPRYLHPIVEELHQKRIRMSGPFPKAFYYEDIKANYFLDSQKQVNTQLVNLFEWFRHPSPDFSIIKNRVLRSIRMLQSTECSTPEELFLKKYGDRKKAIEEYFDFSISHVTKAPWPCYCPKFKHNGVLLFIPPWMDCTLEEAQRMVKSGSKSFPRVPYIDFLTGRRIKRGRAFIIQGERKEELYALSHSYYGVSWGEDGELAYSYDADRYNLSRDTFQNAYAEYAINRQTDDLEYIDEDLRDAETPEDLARFREEYWAPPVSKMFGDMDFRMAYSYRDPKNVSLGQEFRMPNVVNLPIAQAKQLNSWATLDQEEDQSVTQTLSDPTPLKSILKQERTDLPKKAKSVTIEASDTDSEKERKRSLNAFKRQKKVRDYFHANKDHLKLASYEDLYNYLLATYGEPKIPTISEGEILVENSDPRMKEELSDDVISQCSNDTECEIESLISDESLDIEEVQCSTPSTVNLEVDELPLPPISDPTKEVDNITQYTTEPLCKLGEQTLARIFVDEGSQQLTDHSSLTSILNTNKTEMEQSSVMEIPCLCQVPLKKKATPGRANNCLLYAIMQGKYHVTMAGFENDMNVYRKSIQRWVSRKYPKVTDVDFSPNAMLSQNEMRYIAEYFKVSICMHYYQGDRKYSRLFYNTTYLHAQIVHVELKDFHYSTMELLKPKVMVPLDIKDVFIASQYEDTIALLKDSDDQSSMSLAFEKAADQINMLETTLEESDVPADPVDVRLYGARQIQSVLELVCKAEEKFKNIDAAKLKSMKITAPSEWESMYITSHTGYSIPLIADPKYTKHGSMRNMLYDPTEKQYYSLYHFLRMSKAKRYYNRMRELYGFPNWIFTIIFPGNVKAMSRYATDNRCPFYCRSFHQDCQWHEVLPNETYDQAFVDKLIQRRKALAHALKPEYDNACFWISLVPEVNSKEFQQYQRYGGFARLNDLPGNTIQAQSKSFDCHRCAQRYRFNTQLQNHLIDDHMETLKSSSAENIHKCSSCERIFSSRDNLAEHCRSVHSSDEASTNIISNKSRRPKASVKESSSELDEQVDSVNASNQQAYKTDDPQQFMYFSCSHCHQRIYGPKAFQDHVQRCTVKGISQTNEGHKSSLMSKIMDFLKSQLNLLMEVMNSAWNMVKGYAKRFRRLIINIANSLIHLVLNPNPLTIGSFVIVLTNELTSEVSEAEMKYVDSVKSSLTKVITSRTCATAHATPSASDDQQAAEESYTLSMLHILSALLPWSKPNAMLLKARQQKIEAMVRSLGHIKDFGKWMLEWLKKLWAMIQVYFFGASLEDYKHVLSTLDPEEVHQWIKQVHEFEMKIDSIGGLESVVANMVNDATQHMRLFEMRDKGLKYAESLVRLKDSDQRQLYDLVSKTNFKIQKWVDRITPKLLKQIPKHSPFCVYIWGDPGVGKSVMVDPLASFLSSLTNREYDPVKDKFCKSPTAEFWEGYSQQRVVVFDDLLQAKDQEMNIREVGGIIHAASRAMCHLNMATLEDKSTSYFTSEFIFITSNVPPTKEVIEAYVESFGAFARRFDLVLKARRAKQPSDASVFDPSIYQFLVQRWHQYQVKDQSGNEGHFEYLNNPYEKGSQTFEWPQLLSIMTKYYAQKVKKEHDLDDMKSVSFSSPELNTYFRQMVGDSLRSSFPSMYEPIPGVEMKGGHELIEDIQDPNKDQVDICTLEQMEFFKCPGCSCSFHAKSRRQRFADWIHHNMTMVAAKFLIAQHAAAMLMVKGYFHEKKITLREYIQGPGQEGLSAFHVGVLSECNWSHALYSPAGCPFTFRELEIAEFYEAQAYVLDYVANHNAKESFTKWIVMSPLRAANNLRQRIVSKMGFVEDWKQAPRRLVNIVESVAEHTKDQINAAVDSLKRSHDAISNAVVIGTLIMLLVVALTFAMQYNRSTRTIDSILQSAEIKSQIIQPQTVLNKIEAEQEGWGGSGSNMTKSAAKKAKLYAKAHNRILRRLVEQGIIRGKIESEQECLEGNKRYEEDAVEVENDQDLRIKVVLNGIAFIPHDFGDYQFALCKAGETAHMTINRRSRSELIIEDVTGAKSIMSIEGRVTPEQLDALVQDHLQRKVQSKSDREELVRYLGLHNDGLPRAQASMDPNGSQCMLAAIRSIFVVWNLNNTRRVNGFFIKGNIMVVPRHLFDSDEDIQRTTLLISTTQISELEIPLSQCRFMVDTNKDMVLIHHNVTTIPLRPNLVDKFIRSYDDISDGDNGYLLVPIPPRPRSRIEIVRQLEVRNIVFNQQVSYMGATPSQIFTTTGSVNYSADTEVGDCGSLLFRMNASESKKIMGFHVAGSMHGGFASLTPSEMWNQKLQELPVAQNASESLLENMPYDQDLFEVEVQDIPFGKQYRFGSCMGVLGVPLQSDLPSAPRETRIQPSPIQGMLQPPLSKPAHLRPFLRDSQVIDPLKLALDKLETKQILLPQKAVDLAVQAMRSSYSQLPFKPELFGNAGLLTKDEAINGIRGHRWIRPMNMKTSPGYPFCLAGGKEVCLNEREDGSKEMKDFFEQMVDRRFRAALQGQAFPALVIDCLKDERLPNEKVEAGKVRIFNIKPMDSNVVSRIFFLKFLAHLMENHVIGEVSVGINPHGQNWKAFYQRLKNSGQHWLAGDYSAWDKRIPFQCAMGLADLVEDFYMKFPDYSEEHARARKVLVDQDFAGVRLAIGKKGVMYQVHQSMPSGTPLTAVYNSLVNALLYRVVFILIMHERAGWSMEKAANAYKKHVHFAAYGDDHIVRVSDVVFEHFNMVSIAKKMEEYGIKYTAPDKTDKMPMELSDNDLTYLKRSFVTRPNGDLDAPMKLESVLDILSWVHCSGKSEKEIKEACQMAARSTLLELSHHKKEQYFEWYSKILTAMILKGMQPDVLSYEEARKIRQEENSDFESMLDFWW